MDNALISIIIPVYKVEQYLRNCINSVLEQTYYNLEIILIDDGSPDNSGIICDEYASADSRINVIHKKNGGLSDARNAGIDVCNGEYIAFVDSDDVIHPRYIELLFTNLKDADLIFCDYISFNDQACFKIKVKDELKITDFTAREVLSRMLTLKYPTGVIAWNKLYKRSIWSELRYPYGKIHEDEFVIHEILDKCEKVKFLDTPLYYYRQRLQSIMSFSNQNKAMLDKLEALAYRRFYFLKHDIKEGLIELNGEILYRCLLREVNKDNVAWKAIDIGTIFFKNNLAWQSRGILLIKKCSFSFYMLLLNIYKSQRTKRYGFERIS